MSDKSRVSRRQFLNYTLTGVGGFMAAGMLAPMVRFAVDPLLKETAEGEFVAVTSIDEITNEPKRFDFKVKVVDAWYESEEARSAWVFRQDNGEILAMSPVCTHLGCTVNWAPEGRPQNEFFCPCHDGRYEKNGVNIKGTPPTRPLDVYDHKVEDGKLYLGKAKVREGA
ncbi:ubiquinol-cytochrome c reductase iron-sulfur subunit [Bacillus solimangrovi]|uniref:Menaquinol:cytochrome c reductase iron-sulfur subunit n=1 Tax=Bacillus solimangrovi TaxID=1305675 RepID=A0A1E5LHB0_9BACI|nr:ubiquinol-cytochrome c reductase iron-sulfur subunit [Bacillus solimangrovi]OEH93436.1 menaquinol-cytochrome C reductase [Bacillus solimangrovi]